MDSRATLFLDVFVAGALSFGGLAAVLSSLHNNVVSHHQLTTDQEFNRTYSLAVAAPGPNAIFLSLLGYRVAGPWGAVLASVAWAIPTMTLLYYIGASGSSRAPDWLKRTRQALVPVIAGLLVAGALATSKSFLWPGRQWMLTMTALSLLLLRPKWNPIWTVAACAAIGALVLQPAP